MVIVVGCSHPGIDKIVEAAAAINPRIHFIAGGFHLVVSKDAEIEQDRRDPARHVQSRLRGARPLHRRADLHGPEEGLRRALPLRRAGHDASRSAPRRAPFAGAGQDAPAAMNEDDLKSYRTLLANSDDHEHSLLAHDAH